MPQRVNVCSAHCDNEPAERFGWCMGLPCLDFAFPSRILLGSPSLFGNVPPRNDFCISCATKTHGLLYQSLRVPLELTGGGRNLQNISPKRLECIVPRQPLSCLLAVVMNVDLTDTSGSSYRHTHRLHDGTDKLPLHFQCIHQQVT